MTRVYREGSRHRKVGRLGGVLLRVTRVVGAHCAMASIAAASLITSAAQIGQPQTVIDFNQFAGSNSVTTQGPIQVGTGVSFTSTNPSGSAVGSGPYSFSDNGTWNSTMTFAGLDVDQFGGDQYTMKFCFSHPVDAVGGFVNYAAFQYSGFSDVIMSALGIKGNVLESYDINKVDPISTPGETNAGEFIGILTGRDDIAAFTLSNSAVAITDLTFSTGVPEPNAFVLGLIGLIALGALVFFRVNKQTR